jgi:hypothetical protein
MSIENKDVLMLIEIARYNANKALSLLPDNGGDDEDNPEVQALTNAIFEFDTILGKV